MENNITEITSYIQAAVAPVFLIAGVAGILNVFTSRFVRIVDRLNAIDRKISIETESDPHYTLPLKLQERRLSLLKRLKNINLSIFLGALTLYMVAMVILTIFASKLFHFDGQMVIASLFIASMISLSSSLFLFLIEIHATVHFIRTKRQSIYDNIE
ncbi:MAG: DUF2721 domain-containing protein [uncultured Sulfurovum sp.]|uniref:DUF2721 domain-containing protein n=1 Tax=uncultured Sulfurovum sp. TaxID=269237 RepID=A0A6S6TIR8_9BACT|nr:MAG: DUF2721 domain-containing protein [uncultured Sulfurovum sp.]